MVSWLFIIYPWSLVNYQLDSQYLAKNSPRKTKTFKPNLKVFAIFLHTQDRSCFPKSNQEHKKKCPSILACFRFYLFMVEMEK